MKTTNPVTMNINNTIAKGIQKGLKTHHQDHAITPHNFNTINATKSNDNTPGPR